MNDLVGVSIYIFIVRPMQRGGTGSIHITFVMFALSYVINNILAVYSYWAMIFWGFKTGGFILRGYDFNFMGLPGILLTAPVTCIALVVLLIEP